MLPKLAKAQSNCPRLAYGNKAFNLQAAAAKSGETLQEVASARPCYAQCTNTACFLCLCDV